MISKKDFIKITDYLWEIPKSFRSDMRVPARIYASEKMLDEIFNDRSLGQLVNVATLPGIQKYAIAMPDIHEGYGFPIGGVAAMEYPDGVISPGGIGYDINCLHPDTVVSLPGGANLKIKDLVDSKYGNIKLLDKSRKKLTDNRIINWMSRKELNFIYNVKTKFGFSLMLTGDHPMYDGKKMIEAKDTKIGDNVIIDSFEGAEYREPEDYVLIDKEKIISALKKIGLDNNGNRYDQILKWFEKHELMNLNIKNFRIPYLLKIIGLMFGDGTMNFIGKDKKGRAVFYGKKEDLENVQFDLNEIGVNSKMFHRQRNHFIKTRYNKDYSFSVTEHSLRVSSSAFTLLLYILGCPLGNKTKQNFYIPEWILTKSPLWYKRLFLAAFFGAEMSKPKTMNKFNFYAPTVNINKQNVLKENGVRFLEDIKKILLEFRILSTEIVEVDGLGNKETIGLRLQVFSTPKNLTLFFKNINFEYHQEKQKMAKIAAVYLQYKENVINSRRKTRSLVRNLYRQGVPASELVINHSATYANKQFIEHSIWCEDREEPRIAFDFPSFNEFLEKYNYGDGGLIIDEIELIEKVAYDGLVYDITVNHNDHNFIANNFVVSNCGVRFLKSQITSDVVEPYLDELAKQLYKEIPSGVGKSGRLKLAGKEFDDVLKNGASWMIDKGYGQKEDIHFLESFGCLENADPSLVSDHAKSRGHDQLGTMGAGNHFVEVEKVEEIYDEEAAKTFGLFKDQVVVLLHMGSRGLGHQVATDYIRIMMRAMPRHKIVLPDRELACAPFSSEEGQNYFNAMAAAANFAWANRQMIAWEVREAWKNVLGETGGELSVLYDVAHNIAKIEDYEIDGKKKKVIMHRKGATRAFGPGHEEIIKEYRDIGQPVLIPGSMGSFSFILAGAKGAMEEAFGSSCHGAGRRMSRHEAKREISGIKLRDELEKSGVHVQVGSIPGLAEEAPEAYKDVREVVDVVHNVGLAKKVARLKPLAVIKG